MRRNELALLPKLPLLITESADEFDALRDAFEREIKPRGVIEQMYVHDIPLAPTLSNPPLKKARQSAPARLLLRWVSRRGGADTAENRCE